MWNLKGPVLQNKDEHAWRRRWHIFIDNALIKTCILYLQIRTGPE